MHRPSIRKSPWRVGAYLVVFVATACLVEGTALAADLEEATALYRTGKYDEAASQAAESIRRGAATESWYALKIRSEMTRGKYSEAGTSLGELGEYLGLHERRSVERYAEQAAMHKRAAPSTTM